MDTKTAAMIASEIWQRNGSAALEPVERIPYPYNREAEETFLGLARQVEPRFTVTVRNAEIYRRLVQYAFADKSCGLNLKKSHRPYGKTPAAEKHLPCSLPLSW